jgi:hypothetical protein
MTKISLNLKKERKLMDLIAPKAEAQVEVSHQDFLDLFWKNESILIRKMT